MNDIILCCSTNEKYIEPTIAMIRSLEQNLNQEYSLNIFILESQLKNHSKKLLQKQLQSLRIKITFITISEEVLQESQFNVSRHITQETYYRLFIEKYLPKNISKILYLDSDILVQGDISELWNMGFEDSMMLACQDTVVKTVGSSFGINEYQKLGMSGKEPYFNAGVLLIDLEKWREKHTSEKILDYILSSKKMLQLHDQEAMNATLHNEWKMIPQEWNYFINSDEKIAFPKLIHFANNPHERINKPWEEGYNYHFKKLYNSYLIRSKGKVLTVNNDFSNTNDIEIEIRDAINTNEKVCIDVDKSENAKISTEECIKLLELISYRTYVPLTISKKVSSYIQKYYQTFSKQIVFQTKTNVPNKRTIAFSHNFSTVFSESKLGGAERVTLRNHNIVSKENIESTMIINGSMPSFKNIISLESERKHNWGKTIWRTNAKEELETITTPILSPTSITYYNEIVQKARNYEVLAITNAPEIVLFTNKKTIIKLGSYLNFPLYNQFKHLYFNAYYQTSSYALQQWYEQKYPKLKGRFHTIHNGVNTSLFFSKEKQRKQEVRFIYVGSYNYHKGIFTLLEAIQKIHTAGYNVRLSLIGSAFFYDYGKKQNWQEKDNSQIQEIIENCDYIVDKGIVSNDELPNILNQHDVAVVPSIWQEPFGITNIEAMSCGLPVIGSAVGGIPEIIRDKETGLLIKPNNVKELVSAMEFFINNKENIEIMGNSARKHVVQEFSLEKYRKNLLAYLNMIFSQ
jgi:lipopolysaccharide biosynthesis glycosyltransferase/glycosyltransferase involved in cell wall biosynthesis